VALTATRGDHNLAAAILCFAALMFFAVRTVFGVENGMPQCG
jgi:hypothetical protein